MLIACVDAKQWDWDSTHKGVNERLLRGDVCDSEFFRISVELDARSEHWILGASGEVNVAFVTGLLLSLFIKM